MLYFNLVGKRTRGRTRGSIGFYLAKKIVDASGGNITVESGNGKRAKFNIYFKTEPEDAAVLVS